MREIQSTFQQLRSHFEQTRDIAQQESQGDKYTYRDSGYGSYNYTFRSVLRGQKIQDILQEAKTQAPTDHPIIAAADILGSGYVFLKGPLPLSPSLFAHGLDYAVGITLSDARTQRRKRWDVRRNRDIDVIEKNIELPSTWRKVDQLLAEHGTDSFNLILARGIEGGSSLLPALYGVVLGNMYQRLSSRNGVMLIEIPNIVPEDLLLEFVTNTKAHGIDITLGRTPRGYSGPRRVMRIDKHPDSPEDFGVLQTI